MWLIWRANALHTSAKGHEYYLRHYLGTHSNAIADEVAQESVEEVVWREAATQGKMDLVVDLNFRMDTSAMYSDPILPSASWYEKTISIPPICIHISIRWERRFHPVGNRIGQISIAVRERMIVIVERRQPRIVGDVDQLARLTAEFQAQRRQNLYVNTLFASTTTKFRF